MIVGPVKSCGGAPSSDKASGRRWEASAKRNCAPTDIRSRPPITSAEKRHLVSLFGGKDHSTVIHACKVIEEKKEKDPELKARVEMLIKQLRH